MQAAHGMLIICRHYASRVQQSGTRTNPVGIQMLSDTLHKQLFRDATNGTLSKEVIAKIKAHLKKHGLLNKATATLPEVDFELPPMQGTFKICNESCYGEIISHKKEHGGVVQCYDSH